MGPMKLSQAISTLVENYRYLRLLEQEDGGLLIEFVSMGESRHDRFLGLLRDSLFGYRFWESTHRGGMFVYSLSAKDRKEDAVASWLTLISPPAPGTELGIFSLIEDREVIESECREWGYSD